MSQPLSIRSIARSGVLTSIAPKVASQLRAMSASKASRSAARKVRMAALASSRVAASPRKTTTSATLPGGNSTLTRIAAHGSRAAPTVLDNGVALASAAGFASVRLRPMNSRRSPVQSVWAPHVGKSDTRTEQHIRRVACEKRARRGVALGFDKCERGGSRRAQHPLDIGGHAEMMSFGVGSECRSAPQAIE